MCVFKVGGFALSAVSLLADGSSAPCAAECRLSGCCGGQSPIAGAAASLTRPLLRTRGLYSAGLTTVVTEGPLYMSVFMCRRFFRAISTGRFAGSEVGHI